MTNVRSRRSFLPLCRETVDALSALRTRADEAHLIDPVPDWIAQAAFIDEAITFGIFSGETAVGLVSLIDPRLVEDPEDRAHFQPDCLYVWRLMVDADHRGHGHARAAITFADGYAALVGLSGVSLTTMDRAAGNALGLYENLGFLPTGRRLDGEIELIRRHT